MQAGGQVVPVLVMGRASDVWFIGVSRCFWYFFVYFLGVLQVHDFDVGLGSLEHGVVAVLLFCFRVYLGELGHGVAFGVWEGGVVERGEVVGGLERGAHDALGRAVLPAFGLLLVDVLRVLEFIRDGPAGEGVLLVLRVVLGVQEGLVVPAFVDHREVQVLLLLVQQQLLLDLHLLLLEHLLLLALQLEVVDL